MSQVKKILLEKPFGLMGFSGEGGTISNLLEKYGKFNETLIRVYVKQILEGLEYLHARNTIHRGN